MKRILVLTAIMALATGAARAAMYAGEYGWLSFYNTTWSNTPHYVLDPTPGMIFWGYNYGDNTHDVYRQVTWAQPVTINGVRVNATAQLGTGGSLGAWSVQYSVDGSTGWTNVPTSGAVQAQMTGDKTLGTLDVPLTSSVTAKALRVFFAAGSYTVGTANVYSGPSVGLIEARGTVAGGFNMDDPQFNIIATTGVLPSTPTVAFAGNAASGDYTGSNLVDQYFGMDSPRAGFYTPVTSTATMTFDLKTKLAIGTVRLYGGAQYHYLPTSASLLMSDDGVNFVPIPGGTLTPLYVNGGIVQYLGTGQYSARYLRITDWNTPSYVLPSEFFLSIPEPASLSLLAVSGVLCLRRRR